ncbi:MAG: hypothetical protein J6R30_06705 [Bacteroidales bacterium]|nr:hypothetical protein [Bacteroidales bacterium]
MRKIGFRFLAAVASIVAMVSCFEKVVDVMVPEVVAPEVMLEITDAENMNVIEVYSDIYAADVNDVYILSLECSRDGFISRIESSDESVVYVESVENGTWNLCADSPGKALLTLVVENDTEVYRYEYEFVVFGHIMLDAEFDHSYGTAGFRVIDYGFEPVTAEVTVDMQFYGWPGNDRGKIVYADHVVWSDEVELCEDADWSGLVDVEPALNQLYSMAPITDKNGDKLWYGPHGVTMEFVCKLSSPYIIIDGILDDADWGEPDYINFKIEADFVQEGVYQLPEKEGNSAGSGWIENDIFINLG